MYKNAQSTTYLQDGFQKPSTSPQYMCDIEKGRRTLPDDLLPKVAEILLLTEEEKTQMYDLVAMSKNTVSVDICEYIMNKDIVRRVIRTAIKNDIPDDAWEAFFEQTNAFNDDLNKNHRVRQEDESFALFIDEGSDALISDHPNLVKKLL